MVHESDKTLAQKLGFQPGMLAVVLDAPEEVLKELMMLAQVELRTSLTDGADYIQAFVRDSASLEKQLPALKAAMHPTGCLWICWPKKWSEIGGDLDEDAVRTIVKKAGLSNVKSTAVDDTWTGMKFVYRRQDRPL